MDTTGSMWPSFNADKALENVFAYNGFMQTPPVQDRELMYGKGQGIEQTAPVQDPELLYGKEVIKQTILKHETIFRDQVYSV